MSSLSADSSARLTVRADAPDMSISTIGGTSAVQPPPPPPADDGIRKAMDAAAQKLGLSDDQVRSALQSGSSLTDLASQQGVSGADLVSTVADGLHGARLPSGTSATDLATQLVNRKGGGHGGHHHHHGGGASAADQSGDTSAGNLQTLADSLGVDKDTLMQQFQSGDLGDRLSSFEAQYTQASAAATGGLAVDRYA
jgi:uncharacterized protein YidB (DUF937 family)